MEYPHDFPEHLKKPVDVVIHAAEVEFIDAKGQIAPHRFQHEVQRLMLQYVRVIFFGFAEQVVEAVKQGIWNGERAREALPDYLKHLGRHAFFDKYPDPSEYHGSEYFTNTLTHESKHWKEWRAIHEGLMAAAESGKAATLIGPTKTVEKASVAPTISERLDEASLKQNISHEEQAHKIGISRTAYFDVKAGRGGRKSRRKTEIYLNSFFSNS